MIAEIAGAKVNEETVEGNGQEKGRYFGAYDWMGWVGSEVEGMEAESDTGGGGGEEVC